MARGDQVYAFRDVMGIPYEHHGIDCGDGTVIHYSKLGEATIQRTPLSSFARGGRVYVKSQPTAFIADVVVERAESRLGERDYNLFFNNCEHFANWCKTGINESVQLQNFGLQFSQIKQPQVGELARQAATGTSPEKTLQLFENALKNVAIATETILPKYNAALKEADIWRQVAEQALAKDREDLARAALHKKVAAQKSAADLKNHLNQLSDLQLTLEQNQAFAQQQTQ